MMASPPPKVNRRLEKEFQNMKNDTSVEMNIDMVGNDLFHWIAVIPGPEDSPYAQGLFKVDIMFPQDYPFAAPTVKFLTKIYHCNVNSSGGICLDILRDQWSPGLTVSKLLISIRSFMNDPNPGHPLVRDIAKELRTNRALHDTKAREWTEKYAMSDA